MFSYIPRRSLVHRADPLIKLLWFVVLFVAAFSVRTPALIGGCLGAAVLVALVARLGPAEVGKTWGVFLGIFLLLYPLFVLLVTWGAVEPWPLVLASLLMTMRVLAAMTAVTAMTATTTPNGLATAFSRLGLPLRLALLLELSFSLLPEFLREFRSVLEMQRTRGFRLRFRPLHPLATLGGILPVLAPMIFLLLHRAWDMAISLETRGFLFKGRPAGAKLKLMPADLLLVALALGLLAGWGLEAHLLPE
jgi:energy-coupling factor transport system permease protein